MKILFDMANVMKRSLFVGKDAEGKGVPDPEKPDKEVWVNSWQYGFENTLTLMRSALNKYGYTPKDVVMVFEGMTPTAVRARKVAGYNKGRSKRPNEVYQELGRLREEIEKFFLELGAASVTQDLVEGDDILAYLARNSEENCFVYSHDGDLVRLAGANKYGAIVTVGNNDDINRNPFGPFPTDLITIYKALVGDANDNIKGAHGFGDAAFLKVAAQYGIEVYYQIEELIRTKEVYKLQEDVADCKPLKKLVDNEQAVYDSYALATLYDDQVNTVQNPLKWKYGMVRDRRQGDDAQFAQWYGRRMLVHAGNRQQALDLIRGIRTPFVALDLETDVNEESEEWLEAKKKRDTDAAKVDVFGSQLVSCGLTLGPNLQHTFYLTHRHAEEEGVTQLSREEFKAFIEEATRGRRVVAHNAQGFELPVLGREFGMDWLEERLADVDCTKILASYVDENGSLGLKPNAKRWLGYDQETYAEATTLAGKMEQDPEDEDVVYSSLPKGGKPVRTYIKVVKAAVYDNSGEEPVLLEPEVTELWEDRQYKMSELTASHIFNYGTDDTIVTAALYNHWQFRVQLEHAWNVYREVEQKPMYLTTHAFLEGVNISLEEMLDQKAEDDEKEKKARETVDAYLIEKGWTGTVCPEFAPPIEASDIKLAFQIVTGRELDTRVRTPAKLARLVEAEGEDLLAKMIDAAVGGDVDGLNRLVASRFSGAPDLNMDSPKQMRNLMYEVMGLPIRVRNKPTPEMRKKGIREGTPKTDELAIKTALHYDAEIAPADVLNAMLEIKTVETRHKLYYTPYLLIKHPRDQKVHASANQCQTVTRRYSFSDPNLQQMPKKKDKGKFRRVLKPHVSKIDPARQTLIVSLDFNGQELRLAADYSQDENMLACYVGDNLKDIHSLTASAIAREKWDVSISYEAFIGYLEGDDPDLKAKAKSFRDLGKTVNFGEQYGAMAGKVSQTMMVSEEDAQLFLDAKKSMFPGVDVWKEKVVAESKERGYATTRLGARRHLAELLQSDDYMVASKAERQGPNFCIQGSGAEMTKLAMGRMWDRKLHKKYDAQFVAPVHDEVVWSVAVCDLIPFIKELHWCMTQPYADMKVPIVSSISFGPSFGEQFEIGEEPTDEAINEGLKHYGLLLEQAA